MSQNKSKSSLAFILSVIIHSAFAVAIVYTGLDMSLPEGTVSSTEIEYIGGAIPHGNQTSDIEQKVDAVAASKPAPPKVKLPPPPPPAPAPVVDNSSESEVIEPLEEVETTEPLNEVTEDSMPLEETPPEPEIVENFNDEGESLEPAPIDESVAEEVEQEIAEMEDATQLAETEAVQENPVDGLSAANQNAYGTSSGTVQSDAVLSPIPGNKQPDYPMWSRLRRQEGVVTVEFEVLADGSVANSRIVKSSGFEPLDSSALKAHQKWRYRPGKTGTFVKNYNFKLTGSAEEAPSRLRRGN